MVESHGNDRALTQHDGEATRQPDLATKIHYAMRAWQANRNEPRGGVGRGGGTQVIACPKTCTAQRPISSIWCFDDYSSAISRRLKRKDLAVRQSTQREPA
jgi:hypothetical protein